MILSRTIHPINSYQTINNSRIPNAAFALFILLAWFSQSIAQNITTTGTNTIVQTAQVRCSIKHLDSIRVINDTLLQPNLLPVTCTIYNDGNTPAVLDYADLFIGRGMGAYVPLGEKIKQISTPIPPHDSLILTWNVVVHKLLFERIAGITLNVYDRYDVLQTSCYSSFFIPSIDGLRCRTLPASELVYNIATGTFEPDSIRITAILKNFFDSTQFYPRISLDLSRAKHLKLSTFSDTTKPKARINANMELTFDWSVYVSVPPSKYTVDTVDIYYNTSTYPAGKTCTVLVEFLDPTPSPSCILSAPDSISLCGNSYCPEFFTINYRIVNPGDVELPVNRIVLSLGNGLLSDQAMEQTISGILPRTTEYFFWTVHALRSSYARESNIIITCFDESEDELFTCEQSIYLPPTSSKLRCSIETIDTVRFDPIAKKYFPERFPVSFRLKNITDTMYTDIQAQFLAKKSEHFTLVFGQDSEQSVESINGNETRSFNWEILINKSTDETITDTIFIQYRIENNPEWSYCRIPIVVQSKNIVSLHAESSVNEFVLEQNYPNPFNPSTTIAFSIPKYAFTTLDIYNTLGEHIAQPLHGFLQPGKHTTVFDASNLSGGVYTAILRSGGVQKTIYMVLLK